MGNKTKVEFLGGIRKILSGEVDFDIVPATASNRSVPYEGQEEDHNPSQRSRKGEILDVENREKQALTYLFKSYRPERFPHGINCNLEQNIRNPEAIKRDQEKIKKFQEKLRADGRGDILDAVVEACAPQERPLDFSIRNEQHKGSFPQTTLEAYTLEGKTCLMVEAMIDCHSHTGTTYFEPGSSCMPCLDYNLGGCDRRLMCRFPHLKNVSHVCTRHVVGKCDVLNCRVRRFMGNLVRVTLAYAIPTEPLEDMDELMLAMEKHHSKAKPAAAYQFGVWMDGGTMQFLLVPPDAFHGHRSQGIMNWHCDKSCNSKYTTEPLRGASVVGVHQNGTINSLLTTRVPVVGVFPLDKVP